MNQNSAPPQLSSGELLHIKDLGRLISSLRRWILGLLVLVCVGLYTFHFRIMYKYAVNIPYMDDWNMFGGDDHPASIDLSWLYAQYNEHRMATTKILVWLQFQLNGWNYVGHLVLNYFIYGLFLICLIWFARRVIAIVPTWVVLAFVIFMLSPMNWFNHFMGMQSAFHFYLIFFFIACASLFDQKQRTRSLLIGGLASVLAIYSLASGVVSSLVLLFVFCFYKGMRAHNAVSREERRREVIQLMLVVGIVGTALITWAVGYVKPAYFPEIVYPFSLRFWTFYLNLVALGFGIQRISTMAGVVCLLIVLIPMGGGIWRSKRDLSSAPWASYVAVLGILANLASVSTGRSAFNVYMGKTVWYTEFGMPLILLSVCNWVLFLRNRRSLKTTALIGLWLFCFTTFAHSWDFGVYKRESAKRLEGVRCAEAYYQGVGDGVCTTIFSTVSIAPFLEQAKRLNASFYRDLPHGAHQNANKADNYGWYHTRELGNGRATPGVTGSRDILPAFKFPGYMTDLNVLNGGSVTGSFVRFVPLRTRIVPR